MSDGVSVHNTLEYFGERMYALDVGQLPDISVDTMLYAGNSSEADQTNMAWLIHDGKKLISCNKLSYNISVVDVASGTTDTLINYGAITGLKIVPGKTWR